MSPLAGITVFGVVVVIVVVVEGFGAVGVVADGGVEVVDEDCCCDGMLLGPAVGNCDVDCCDAARVIRGGSEGGGRFRRGIGFEMAKY